MSFQSQVAHALDEEHRASLDILGRIEQAFARAPRKGAGNDPDLQRLAGEFARHLEQDIGRHFDFEEAELFPRMAEMGEGDIAEMLADEHDAIREAAETLLPLAWAASSGELDEKGWQQLKIGVMDMVERQVAHIQKETMGLLPVVEDLLDGETDRELAFQYAAA